MHAFHRIAGFLHPALYKKNGATKEEHFKNMSLYLRNLTGGKN